MNRAKARGTAAESAVVAWLRNNGFPFAERRALAGNADKGDVLGVPGVAVEVKDCKAVDLPGWLDEAVVEATNSGSRYGVVVRRRRGRPDVGEWYAIMRCSDFFDLIRGDGGAR